MIRGLYTSASGMLAQAMQTDVIANNIANVNTAGFKKDAAIAQEFKEMLIYRINDNSSTSLPRGLPAAAVPIGALGTGTMIERIYTNYTQGTMQNTGNPLDAAIQGDGYFTIETMNGLRYTRNGAFVRGLGGELITGAGDLVLGNNGPIRLDGQVTIDETGGIYNDGVFVDTLRVTAFSNQDALEKQGDTYFRASEQAGQIQSQSVIWQGFIERPNVNTVSEMINLINSYRNYETNQRMVRVQDDTLGKAVNDVGKI